MQTITSYIEAPTYLSEAELSAIQHACDWSQLRERTSRALGVFGVDEFMFQTDVTLSNGIVQQHTCSTLPDSLVARFRDEHLPEVDPIGRHILESVLPCEWDINDVCAESMANVYLQLRMCGVKRGISMAIRSERATTRIDFYRKAAGTFPRSAALRANLLLLASYLHEAGKTIGSRESGTHIEPLTERELECLRLSACGKTGKEIGMILGISQRTVYFHMKNIAKKFNVYSTRHAIGRAVAVGLIKPGG